MKKKVRKFAGGGTTAEMNMQRFSPQTLVESVNPMAVAALPKLGGDVGKMADMGIKPLAERIAAPGAPATPELGGKELTTTPSISLTSVSVEKGSDSKKEGMKRGGTVKKKIITNPKVSSASKRADGCITKGKTKGRMV
jgi:hypothetical protein